MDSMQKLDEYLAKAKLVQLATVKDGKPWVCTVNYIADAERNIYWMSMRSSRHSRELVANNVTAAAIVVDPSLRQGLQLEGRAREVAADKLEAVHQLYSAAFGNKPDRLKEAQSGDSDMRTYYIFTPSFVQIVDLANNPGDPLQLTLS